MTDERTGTTSPKKDYSVFFTVDELVAKIEAKELGWDLGNTSRLIEVRIWEWPSVIGRYRPGTEKSEPLAYMLKQALIDAGEWDDL